MAILYMICKSSDTAAFYIASPVYSAYLDITSCRIRSIVNESKFKPMGITWLNSTNAL